MKIRESNYELLRIISMFMIIVYHLILHTKIINNCNASFTRGILLLILYISIVHVNSFILVMGYYQVKSEVNIKKCFSIFGISIFYMILFTLIFQCLGLIKLSFFQIVQEILLNNSDSYWFIKCYLFLYILSPYINKFINCINKVEYQKLLTTLTILFSIIPFISAHKFFNNNGYSLYSFIYLYLVGAYFRIYPLNEEVKIKEMFGKNIEFILIIIYFISVTINFSIFGISSLFLKSNINNMILNDIDLVKFDYSNIFVVVQSVVYFLLFGTFQLKSKIINIISKFTLGIYLIHDNIFVRGWLYNFLNTNFSGLLSSIYAIFFVSFLIFLLCSLIEGVRQLFFNKLIKNIVLNKLCYCKKSIIK